MPYIPDYKPGGGDYRPATPTLKGAMAPGEALGDLAKGIAATADPLADLAASMRQAEKVRKESEIRASWSSGEETLTQDLATDADPQSHLRKTEDFLSNQHGVLQKADLPPESREALAQEFSLFDARVRTGNAQGAATLQQNQAKSALDREAAIAMRSRDHEGYTRVLGIYATNFGATPADITRAQEAYSKNLLLMDLEEQIKDEPLVAKTRLESKDFLEHSPNVTEQERRRALSLAGASIEKKRGQEFQELQAALVEKKLEPKHIEAARYLTKMDRATLTRSYQITTPPSNESFNAAWSHMDKLRVAYENPMTGNSEYHLLYNDARTHIMNLLPAQWQGELPKVLDTLTPGDRVEGVRRASPSNGNDLLALGRAAVEKALHSSALGDISSSAPVDIRQITHGRAREINEELSRQFGDVSKILPEQRADYIMKVHAEANRLIAQKAEEAKCPIPARPQPIDHSKTEVMRKIMEPTPRNHTTPPVSPPSPR